MILVIARLRWAVERRLTDSAMLVEPLRASSGSRWTFAAWKSRY
jgi:hypothetical protein